MTKLFDKNSDSAVSLPFRVSSQVTVYATGLALGDEIQFETVVYEDYGSPTQPGCATSCDPCLPAGNKIVVGTARLRCCGCSCDSPQAEYPVRITEGTPYVVIDAPQNVDIRAVYIGGNLGDFNVWYENTSTEDVTDAMRGCCNPPKLDVAVEKSVSNDDPRVGEAMSYTLVVSNAGPFSANNTVVKDAIPEAMTVTSITVAYQNGAAGAATLSRAQLAAGYAIPVLPINGVATITINGSFTEVGAELNRAEVFAPPGTVDTNPANNGSEVLVNVKENVSDVSITKTVSNPAPRVGEPVSFVLTAHNSGPQDADGMVVADVLPVGFTAGAISINYAGGAAGPAVVSPAALAAGVSIPTVPAGGDVLVTVTGSFTSVGSFLNSATVKPPAGRVDSDVLNNEANVSVRVVANEVDLFVTKGLFPTAPIVGESTTYLIRGGNAGPQDADGAIVVDVLPAEFVFASASVIYGGGAAGPATVTAGQLGSGFVIPTLPEGGAFDITVVGSFSTSGTFTNDVSITAPDGRVETDPGNNGDFVVTTVGRPKADLSVTKTSSPASPAVGDTVTWTVTAANAGPAPALGSILTDAPPTGLTFSPVTYTYAGGATGPATSTMAALVTGVPVGLPVGGSVEATYTAVIPAGAEGQVLLNTATIMPPDSVDDPVQPNNSDLNTVVVAPACYLRCDDELQRIDASAAGGGVCISLGNVTYGGQGRAVFQARDFAWVLGNGTNGGENIPGHLAMSITNIYDQPAVGEVRMQFRPNMVAGTFFTAWLGKQITFFAVVSTNLAYPFPGINSASPRLANELVVSLRNGGTTLSDGALSAPYWDSSSGTAVLYKQLAPGEIWTPKAQWWAQFNASENYPAGSIVVHGNMSAQQFLHRNTTLVNAQVE